MKTLARKLRKQQTNAERLLWGRLRNRQMAGCKFRRQFPIGVYVVDFVCLERRLIIELDGGQHAEAVSYDKTRTRFLEGQGFTVVRFWNNEVFSETDGVLQRINEVMTG